MKTPYESLGRHALACLRRTTAQAYRVQAQQLAHLMQENQDTVFGTQHHFAEVRTMRDYQDAVPCTDYDDYASAVQCMLNGQSNLLTRHDPIYYSISSGSTGTPKYVPVSRTDMRLHYLYVYGGIYGMLREYYPTLPSDALFGKIFQVSEFAKTHLDNGVLCGIRSASLYQWLDRRGTFDAQDYCVPKEVLFPAKLEDLTYVKVRFALAERNLCAIHGVFSHRVVSILAYIRRNWDLLLRDMQYGTVDDRVALSQAWKEKVCRWLPPDPERAAALRALHVDRDPQDMVRKLWPKIKYIIAIGGQRFPRYTALLQAYAPDVPIHHFIYGASEGFLSIADGVNRPDAYILLPEAGLFEFIPLDSAPDVRPLTMEQVQVGRQYELIFTNHSGLYRYRMRDVLEVVGFSGQSPIVRFCYRRNQVLNLADEKTNDAQLAQAMQLLTQQASVSLTGYCVQADDTILPGRYRFYLECPPFDQAAALVDACLCRASLSYQGCRNMHDIAAPIVRFVPAGCFARYERHIAASGRDLGQYKPVCVLDTPEKQAFFAREADRMGMEP